LITTKDIKEIVIKNSIEIEYMRINGKILGKIFGKIKEYVKPGISTFEIDKIIEDLILSNGGVPSFKGYEGYPAASCISVNDVVIHGIPNKEEKLKEGDIVGIDIGFYKNKFHVDSSYTFKVGKVDDIKEKLCNVTLKALMSAISIAREGRTLFDISNIIQTIVEENNFSVVREFVGHGVGKKLHEPPQIPNYRIKGLSKIKLRKGMTLAIEPMINAGSKDIKIDKDSWTVRTADGKPSAHYEHTIVITDKAPEILTFWEI